MALRDIEWNYKAPVVRSDGSLLIEPNFPALKPGEKMDPNIMRLRLAKNKELPEILQDAGHLTPAEDRMIQYHNLKAGEGAFVGTAFNPVFTARLFDEKMIKERADTYARFIRVRGYISARPVGKVDGPSEYEIIHIKGPENSRGYSRGFTMNPQADAAGAALVTKALVENLEVDARISRDIYAIANDLTSAVAPQEDLDLLD